MRVVAVVLVAAIVTAACGGSTDDPTGADVLGGEELLAADEVTPVSGEDVLANEELAIVSFWKAAARQLPPAPNVVFVDLEAARRVGASLLEEDPGVSPASGFGDDLAEVTAAGAEYPGLIRYQIAVLEFDSLGAQFGFEAEDATAGASTADAVVSVVQVKDPGWAERLTPLGWVEDSVAGIWTSPESDVQVSLSEHAALFRLREEDEAVGMQHIDAVDTLIEEFAAREAYTFEIAVGPEDSPETLPPARLLATGVSLGEDGFQTLLMLEYASAADASEAATLIKELFEAGAFERWSAAATVSADGGSVVIEIPRGTAGECPADSGVCRPLLWVDIRNLLELWSLALM